MQKLCTVPCGMKHFTGDVSVVLWERGDPFPALGPSVGVDTETERFTDVIRDPPVVVLGVFDAASSTCYVVYWQHVAEFMRELCARDIEQRYFNLGYDEPVLDNEDERKALMLAIDGNRVFDMSIRQKLYDIEKLGFTRKSLNTLAACTKYYEHWELDKGDGSDTSARMSFKRYNADGSLYKITDEQARYLPYDCIATWCLGEAIPMLAKDPRTGVPFELAHVKGMVVLAHISINGFPVDMKVWSALEDKLKSAMDKYRQELLQYGYPDPYKDAKQEKREVVDTFHEEYKRLMSRFGLQSGFTPVANKDSDETDAVQWTMPMPSKNAIRRAIVYIWEHEPEETQELAEDLHVILEDPKPKNLRKAESTVYDQICEDYELGPIDDASRDIALRGYLGAVLKSINEQLASGDEYAFKVAVDAADDLLDHHADWLAKTEAPSPKKFFQQHIRRLMDDNPKLELDMTEKSKEIKLAKDDMWRLEDLGIEDKFLESYTGFMHVRKLLSTYLDRKYIGSDGKVRAHYTNILKTGRTSCASPNLQNLPSHDATWKPKNAYVPPKGSILCATDYSFVELVCLAQSCYTRFGQSTLRDVINADVDPHYWFAGVRDGLITNDTSFIHSPQKIADLKKFLKENISTERRQNAKSANFGFGGGMSAETFYKNCRKQGIKMTPDDAVQLRKQWVSAFPEINLHFNPERMPDKNEVRTGYGITQWNQYDDPEFGEEEEDDAQEEGKQKQKFIARLVNGMVRSNGSYCSILNINFQGLAAYGLKLGLWNIAMAGYLDRLLNEVHDEANYWLYPEELKVHIPIIEKCMISGMRTACPDVMVKVESSCMLHWDKKAVEFNKLQWDDNGLPIIDEPPFVQEVYGIKKPDQQETE